MYTSYTDEDIDIAIKILRATNDSAAILNDEALRTYLKTTQTWGRLKMLEQAGTFITDAMIAEAKHGYDWAIKAAMLERNNPEGYPFPVGTIFDDDGEYLMFVSVLASGECHVFCMDYSDWSGKAEYVTHSGYEQKCSVEYLQKLERIYDGKDLFVVSEFGDAWELGYDYDLNRSYDIERHLSSREDRNW